MRTSSGTSRRSARRTTRAGRAFGVALAGAAATVVLTGCAGFSYTEKTCSDGEYPVLTVGGTGSACVPDGEQPPAGYVRYPEGKVPQEVDDTWDVYWRTHTVDKDGKIVDAPEEG
ncbi:hypothetical protein [Streptomyces sp. NPDC048659]|uniref:SCO0607 family lipoprotein n=1 Tax=Streptomyces sp. NPDC048659 TaxID=3155489 RepID=UPI0034215774